MQQHNTITLARAITQSAQNPAPTTIPVTANRSLDYVRWGTDNCMGEYIDEIASASPTQSAILATIQTLMVGAGIEFDNLDDPNPDQSWDSIIEFITKDYATYNQFALEVILNNDGETCSFYNVPVSSIRIGKLTDDYGNFDHYCVADNWRKANKRNTVNVKKFDGKLKKGEPQLVVFKDMKTNDRFYPTPSWWSAAPYAQADASLAKFYRSEVDGSFRGQTCVSFPYNLDEEGQRAVAENIRESFVGPDSSNSVLCLFSENEQKPEVSVVNAPSHDVFNSVTQLVQYELCSSNRIHPMLAGLSINSGFSQQSEIYYVTYTTFKLTVINQKRRFILQALNGLLRKLNMDKGEKNQLRFVDFDIKGELQGLTAKNDAIEESVNDTDGMNGVTD